MLVEYDYEVERLLSPHSDPDGPSTIRLHVHWKHCRRVFQSTDLGLLLPPIFDEPMGDLCYSRFTFSFPPISQFLHQMRISIASLHFPRGLSYFLYDHITTSVIDLAAANPTEPCPFLVLVASINFIHRVYRDEIIPPPQPAATVDENPIPDTTTWASEVGQSETFIPPRDTRLMLEYNSQQWQWWREHDFDFLDEDVILGSDLGGLVERGKWTMGGGEEVACSVCLDNFSEGQEVMTMACKHTYHEQCLLTWLSRILTCPLCRRSVL